MRPHSFSQPHTGSKAENERERESEKRRSKEAAEEGYKQWNGNEGLLWNFLFGSTIACARVGLAK